MSAPVHVTLPLPALSVLTGRSLAPGYCPACLDKWFGHSRANLPRVTAMHAHCLELLEAIAAAPAVECAA